MDEKLKEAVLKTAKKVDKAAIEMLIESVDEKFKEIMRYQIECGGKRLRPFLAVASSS